MKSKSKLEIFVAASILIYLICIFYFTGKTKEPKQVLKEEVTKNKLVDEKNKEKTEDKKENLTEEKKEETEAKAEQTENLAYPENTRYAATNITAYNNENKEKKLSTIYRGTRFEILESKELVNKKKNKDGSVTEEKYLMHKIAYKKDLKDMQAWIEDKNIVKTINESLKAEWKDLDFSIYPKKEYANNPRVKVKGIYVTANSIAIASRFDELLKIAKENGINAFVIDVKEDAGTISFPMPEEVKAMNKGANDKPTIKDIGSIMKKLKENNIYAIARIVSFKDPIYAANHKERAITYKANNKPFTNSDGLIWVSPHDRDLWKYNLMVAKEAAKAGFNEIQFDYVRFPASNGGKLDSQLNYRNTKNETKVKAIQEYLKYARQELKDYNVYISADIYGQVASSYDDMSLGQHYETVANIVDYVCPMQYPSHYGNGVYGLKIPDAEPYKTVYYSTLDAINRSNNIEQAGLIRPWLQAFTAKWIKGHINYGPKEVKTQVKALKDLGVEEYILWSPTNRYDRYF